MQDYHTNVDRLAGLQGTTVYDRMGEKIGTVEEIFYDDDTRQPEWIGIGTGFFGTKRVLVPVHGAAISEDAVTVPYEKGIVKDSPDLGADRIDEQTERDLYSYYGLGAPEPRPETMRPESGENAVTRSEEELRVGKREAEAGRVRLRKWVETEPVEAQVELGREKLRIRRERIDEPAAAGTELGEQEIEVILHEERPVVEKEVVARERISLEREVETAQETVSDEVRRERIEVEGDVEEAPRRDDAR